MYLTQDNCPAPERIHNDISGVQTHYALRKNVFIFLRSKRYELHIWIHCTFNYLTTHSSLTSLSKEVEFVHVKEGSKGSKLLGWATSQNSGAHKEHSQQHCSNEKPRAAKFQVFTVLLLGRSSGLWNCAVGWAVLMFQRVLVPSSLGGSSPKSLNDQKCLCLWQFNVTGTKWN